MRKPASFLHRVAALLLLLGVLAAIFFVVHPVRDTLSEMNRQIAENASMIQRLRAGSVSIGTYSEDIASVEAAVRSDPRFLAAASPALASAALQQIIRLALEEEGATLRSVQDVLSLSGEGEGTSPAAPKPVTVRVTVLATYPDILAAIGRIEAARPYLFIDQLSFRTPLVMEAKTEWAPLTIRFDVTAYMPPTVSMSQ